MAGLGVAVTGDVQGKIMTEVQPMKMAAAEALYDTEDPRRSRCSPSAASTAAGEVRDQGPRAAVVPRHRARSTARSQGINELRAQYEQKYGQDPGATYYSPGDYTPIIPITYWTFRLMIGLGLARRRRRRG